jgi:hypothetical protein
MRRNNTLSTTQREKLEELIDHSSFSGVVMALVQIANEKADHIRANWQDEGTAKRWERAAKAVDSIVDRTFKTEV